MFRQQIEDKFSPYAKETLAKLITFLEVRNTLRSNMRSSDTVF